MGKRHQMLASKALAKLGAERERRAEVEGMLRKKEMEIDALRAQLSPSRHMAPQVRAADGGDLLQATAKYAQAVRGDKSMVDILKHRSACSESAAGAVDGASGAMLPASLHVEHTSEDSNPVLDGLRASHEKASNVDARADTTPPARQPNRNNGCRTGWLKRARTSVWLAVRSLLQRLRML